jgi:hypothetical protein
MIKYMGYLLTLESTSMRKVLEWTFIAVVAIVIVGAMSGVGKGGNSSISTPRPTPVKTPARIPNNEPTQQITTTNQPNPTTTQEFKITNDSYTSIDGKTYAFEILPMPEGKSMASFKPFIPRNDGNLVEAIFRVFIASYGADTQIKPEPLSEVRNGVNHIKFESDNGNYYVTPVKEDTGEVHTIIFWKE